jgi:uncharacterized protein (DUF433 family)
MNYRDYITIDPNKRGGKPCVRGLRITVYEVLEYLASDMSEAQILEDFPDLTREDLKACIALPPTVSAGSLLYQPHETVTAPKAFNRNCGQALRFAI